MLKLSGCGALKRLVGTLRKSMNARLTLARPQIRQPAKRRRGARFALPWGANDLPLRHPHQPRQRRSDDRLPRALVRRDRLEGCSMRNFRVQLPIHSAAGRSDRRYLPTLPRVLGMNSSVNNSSLKMEKRYCDCPVGTCQGGDADRCAARNIPRAPEWMPIETAPRDVRVLVFRPTAEKESRKVGTDYRDGVHYDGAWWHSRRDEQPTYWQPLPEPPNA